MKKQRKVEIAYSDTELMILPDGRILVQNLTRPMAELLRELNPADKTIAPRAEKIP